jgi:hypothetical protein
MKRLLLAAVAALLSLSVSRASAHRIDEYLQATLVTVEGGQVRASMRLFPGALIAASVIASIDGDSDGVFSEDEQQAYARSVLHDLLVTVDGAPAPPRLLSWRFPSAQSMREGTGELGIDYAVEVSQRPGEHRFGILNQHRGAQSVYLVNVLAPTSPNIHIVTQARDRQQSRYELAYQRDIHLDSNAPSPASAPLAWWDDLQMGSLFRLGMRHIAEGTDHLLFLLVLLLPAPLLASGSRWTGPAGMRRTLRRVFGIVTAFTVGHSLTLMLAVFGNWTVPAQPVEVMIAVSILVSAVHAFRPIFPGREAVVAGLFGLVHGLAFAATLDQLGLGIWQRLAGTLAFNLGIETMQLLVVAVALPMLLMASRTAAYRALRAAGAILAGVAALYWLVERLQGA